MEHIKMRVQDAMASHSNGLTQAKVAREIGMSRDALSRALGGQRKFTALELGALSRLLGVSVDWLVTGAPATDGIGWQHHRLTEILAFPSGAYRLVGLSTAEIPRLGEAATAEQAAEAAAGKLNGALGKEFVRDLPAAIEQAYGIGVFVLAQGPDFDARAMGSTDISYIMVKATGAWYQANLALARELGVLLCGRDADTGRHERGAKAWALDFANALLLPAARLREIDWARQTPRELAAFLWNTGVSAQALMDRLDALSLDRGPALVHADEGTLQLLVWQYPGSLSHHRAGAYRAPRIPADLFGAHLSGMRHGLLDGSSLAWMLDIPLGEL